MTARILLDTNLLVYCYDRAELAKQQRALEVLGLLAYARIGAISTQVLAEFFVTVIRKLRPPLTVEDAAGEVSRHSEAWTVLDVTRAVVREALRGVQQHQLNYWDAQLWAVALLHRIPVLLSEDFSDGRVVEGVRFVNPLLPAFRMPEWI